MIPRLKRQTKHRHSVKKDGPGIASKVAARQLAEALLKDLSVVPRDFICFTANPTMYDEPIIGAHLTPDVWAP